MDDLSKCRAWSMIPNEYIADIEQEMTRIKSNKEVLFAALAQAAAAYPQALAYPEDDPRRHAALRRRQFLALEAIIQGLSAEKIPAEHLVSLRTLMTDLLDLNKGKHVKRLEAAQKEYLDNEGDPHPVLGNRGKSTNYAARMTIASAAVDGLVKHGMSVEAALKEVAEEIGLEMSPVRSVPSRFVLELGDAISGIPRVPSQAARSIG